MPVRLSANKPMIQSGAVRIKKSTMEKATATVFSTPNSPRAKTVKN
jgi:hypothetical protein